MVAPTTNHTETVAILYPGDLGAAVGGLLAGRGIRVVTALTGRGVGTARRATLAGIEVLASLQEVSCLADIAISLVPPGAAYAVAEQFCAAACHPSTCLFVDANSVAPATARRIADRLARTGIECVDAGVAGLASQLAQRGTVYLSGASAQRVAHLLAPSVRTRVVGAHVGAASAMKMMIGGLSKGLSALFLELCLAARQAGMLHEVIGEYTELYPAITAVATRMLPTYPQHAIRRGDELREVGHMMEALGLRPTMLGAAAEMTEAIGAMALGTPATSTLEGDTRAVIEAVFAHGLLREVAGPGRALRVVSARVSPAEARSVTVPSPKEEGW